MYSKQFIDHAKLEIEELRNKANLLENVLETEKLKFQSEEENEDGIVYKYSLATWVPGQKETKAEDITESSNLSLAEWVQASLDPIKQTTVSDILEFIGDRFAFGKTPAKNRIRTELYRMEKMGLAKRTKNGTWIPGKKAV